MDDGGATALEAALADAGTLLTRLEKYRGGRRPEVAALRRRIFAAGDGARRLHRTRTLYARHLAVLHAEVTGAVNALAGIIDGILASADYRAAVEAHRRGDAGTLERLLPRIFADLTPAPPAGSLFWSFDWARRGRPMAPAAVVDALDHLRREGLPAAGDTLDPGADPELPAVAFSPTWPAGAPVALQVVAADLGAPLLRSTTDGQILLHRPTVRAPFRVALMLERDEVDEWVADPLRYRDALMPLLQQREFHTVEITTSAAP